MSLSTLITRARNVAADCEGGVVILSTFALPVVLGAMAFAIDTGYWYTAKRQTQQQADTAVLGAVRAMQDGASSSSTLRAVALNDATRNGFVSSATDTLTLNWPPVSGAYVGNTSAVEVIVQRQVPSFFAQVLGRSSVTMSARAVAKLDYTDACVLTLSASASRALTFSGSTSISATKCGFMANSKASDAVYIGGSATVVTKSLNTSGGTDIAGHYTSYEASLTNLPSAKDPYAGLTVPTIGSPTATNFKVTSGDNQIIYPGVYKGGITMNGSGTLYMNKGTYILDGGDFTMTGSGRIRCGNCASATDGVTIILTAKSGNVGSVSISGSGDVELSAPGDSGNPYQGVLFYQDRTATKGNSAKLNGGSAMKLSGALYFPQADMTYNGSNSFTMGKNCVVVVSMTATFTGNSGLNQDDCTTMGTKTIDLARWLALAE